MYACGGQKLETGKSGRTEAKQQVYGRDGLEENGPSAVPMSAVGSCCFCRQGSTGGGRVTRGLTSLVGGTSLAADGTRSWCART